MAAAEVLLQTGTCKSSLASTEVAGAKSCSVLSCCSRAPQVSILLSQSEVDPKADLVSCVGLPSLLSIESLSKT
jgi:hypothetical protein